jgi:Ca2+-binding RTX toxin-like protein
MRGRRIAALLSGIAVLALLLPATGQADHVRTQGAVSAQVVKLKSRDYWVVEIVWSASCEGVPEGSAWYDGHLYMIDADTGERIYVGGVVNTSGHRNVSETREWWVSSLPRPRRLIPELTIGCFQNFPLHGGPDVTVTGNEIVIPPSFSAWGGSGGGGGGDGGGGAYPTDALGPNGCLIAVLGTNGADKLDGTGAGDVIVGFAASDRLRGRLGHDCLIGGTGRDRLEGEAGNDRLTGGSGGDVLIDELGLNAFEAGPGADYVNSRNGNRETVRCGPGFDRVRADRRDRLRGCERRSRS